MQKVFSSLFYAILVSEWRRIWSSVDEKNSKNDSRETKKLKHSRETAQQLILYRAFSIYKRSDVRSNDIQL